MRQRGAQFGGLGASEGTTGIVIYSRILLDPHQSDSVVYAWRLHVDRKRWLSNCR